MSLYRKFFAILLICLYPVAGLAHSVRPGTSPDPHSQTIQLQMNAAFVFPSSDGFCAAGIENPAGSGIKLRYTLEVSPQEIARVSGMIGHGLHPQNSLILFQSNLLMPGERIDRFSLRKLPDGQGLPEGSYQASMNVTPYRVSDNLKMDSEFHFKVDIIIMAAKMRAQADPNGLLDIQAFNNTTNAARFMLVMQEESLLNAEETNTFSLQDRHCYLSLAQSGIVKPGEGGQLQLHALPDGGSFKAGAYTAWLLRAALNEAEEVYAVSRVRLSLPNDIEGLKAGDSAFPLPDSRAIAQAVVNCEYLLGMDYLD